MDRTHYLNELYPLQDEALGIIRLLDTEFYLTGGTAASRVYLQHRFSEDLDLCVNDNSRFALWRHRIIDALAARSEWQVQISSRDERFARIFVTARATTLKIEMVNDVPSHIGAVRDDPLLGRVDSAESILANKLSAVVDREEPKDLADIWGFCCKFGLPLDAALQGAHSKAAGLFPADIARRLLGATVQDWQVVLWADPPAVAEYLRGLHRLGESLLLID